MQFEGVYKAAKPSFAAAMSTVLYPSWKLVLGNTLFFLPQSVSGWAVRVPAVAFGCYDACSQEALLAAVLFPGTVCLSIQSMCLHIRTDFTEQSLQLFDMTTLSATRAVPWVCEGIWNAVSFPPLLVFMSEI